MEDAFEQYDIKQLPTIVGLIDKKVVLFLSRPSSEDMRRVVCNHLPMPTLVLDADF
jgi:hypothetical protein